MCCIALSSMLACSALGLYVITASSSMGTRPLQSLVRTPGRMLADPADEPLPRPAQFVAVTFHNGVIDNLASPVLSYKCHFDLLPDSFHYAHYTVVSTLHSIPKKIYCLTWRGSHRLKIASLVKNPKRCKCMILDKISSQPR